jgi:conjugative relaxase-like TrwC/TraI family protein
VSRFRFADARIGERDRDADRPVLNIGRLSPDAADYYLGEVATSAEDYYTGRGESEGRWVGSLCDQLGLCGSVQSADFWAVLDGRHPHTGERLVASRTGRCRVHAPAPVNQPSLLDADTLDVARTAARLRVGTRWVRRLLEAGRSGRDGLSPDAVLVGERVSRPGHKGPAAWAVPRVEVERFEAARRAGKARPGYDLTLRPPKSVSILWALAPKEQRQAIRAAHREAVDMTVAYLENHALYARRGGKGRGRVVTDGIVAAAFDHRTSRAGDPLLHTHVVCANLTHTADGDWRAIDARPIYEHARPGGFVYQAHLRHALARDLGVRFRNVRNGWAEVEGVPDQVVRAFSKRRDEIEEMAAEAGYTSARAHQTATLATRAAKEYGVDADVLEARWRQEAADLGFGAAEVAACFGNTAQAEATTDEQLLAELAGAGGLTRQASMFTRGDVVQGVAERITAHKGAGDVDRLTNAFLASPLVQPLAQAGAGELVWHRGGTRTRSEDLARYSTPELLGLERRLLDSAEHGFGTPVPVADPTVVEAVVTSRPELSTEQVAMVRAVCGPGPTIQAIAGRPGAGKTFATAACVEALVKSGIPVVGAALSATAAAELEQAAQFAARTGQPASTIARLLMDVERHGLAPRTVVFVDEASMAGTRDLARLADHVASAGGALKLVGDPDQHGAVETGGLFNALVARQGAAGPRLMENNRQNDPEERAAVHEYREGLVESALSRYDAAGRVIRSGTASESYDRMVADWYTAVAAGSEDPMIAGPNQVRHALNRRARALLDAKGKLAGPALTVDGREFRAGDWVVTRKNAHHLRSPDGTAFVKNGSHGRVIDVDTQCGWLTVEFKMEGTIRLPADYLSAGWVEHGYARTTYGVQGATLRRTLYHAGDGASFEEGYVALTRAADETRIYLVDGSKTADEDVAHRAHAAEVSGLATVCQSLERRRAKNLAHDADPLAASAIDHFCGWSVEELAGERRRLEQVLSAAPTSVDRALAATEAHRDALLVKRQAWQQRLAAAADGRGRVARRLLGRDRAETRRGGTAEIERLDEALAKIDARLGSLRARADQRRSFFTDHSPEVERVSLVREAESAAELQARLRARLDGSEPDRAGCGRHHFADWVRPAAEAVVPAFDDLPPVPRADAPVEPTLDLVD